MLVGKVDSAELADKILMLLKHNYKLQGRWVRTDSGIEVHVDGKWVDNKWAPLSGDETIPDIETLKTEAASFEPPPPPPPSYPF